jgi:hypothetical protein
MAKAPTRGNAAPRALRDDALTAVVLAGITALLYAPVLGFDFVQLDDPVQVTENARVLSGLTWSNIWWALTASHAGYWMPLVWISHMLDVQFYGLNAGGHHLTNLVLHVCNTALLFWILVRSTGARTPSALVAALFAVHPMHVESVAWVTERKDVLSTLFALVAIWAYGSYVRRPSWRLYAGVVAAFCAGLMAKAMVVTLPLVLLLWDVWPLSRWNGRRDRAWQLIREKLPLFALSIAASVIVYLTQEQAGAVVNLEASPFGARVGNALVSYVTYVSKMIWPVDLVVLYPFPDTLPLWQVLGAGVLLTGITVSATRSWRRHPHFTVGWLWYVITLLPVIGLVRVGVQGMADRFTYVPFIGLFIWIAWTADVMARRGRVALTVVRLASITAVAALIVAAHGQIAHWQNNRTLFTHATMVSLKVDEYQAHLSLAATLKDQGRIDEAVGHLEDASRLKPEAAEPHTGLGLLRVGQGAYADALPHFTTAARLAPGVSSTHVNVGATLLKLGRKAEAAQALTEALRLDPRNEAVRRALSDLQRQ